jgi:hypothetical protein
VRPANPGSDKPIFLCAIARGGIDVPGVIRLLRLSLAGENRSTGLRIASTVEQGGVYLPVADGLAAAHQKRIPKGQLADKFRCVLKAPRKAYRLYRVEWITPDREVVARFKQKTSDLRPGERLMLFRFMADMYLDNLALAGGQAADILRRAKRRALRESPQVIWGG